MFEKLKIILKSGKSPVVLVVVSASAALLLLAVSDWWYQNYTHSRSERPDSVSKVEAVHGEDISTPADSVDNIQPASERVDRPNSSSPNQAANTDTSQTPQRSTESKSSPAPKKPPAVKPAAIEISLSLNDVFKGKVSLAPGSNHCDVLKKALDTGVISSLDLRYSNTYATYAVYVIDGIGDSNAVWWTYKVNGKSPPYGCSGVKAAQGDSVNWEYIKQ